MSFDLMRYRFQQFIARGGVSIFVSLFVVFLIILVATFVIRLAVVWIFGDAGDQYGGRHFWATWTQLTDPGNMFYDVDSGWKTKTVSILTGMAGIIIFSALIAFITTALDAMIQDFRQGRGRVIESDHTLILGWSDQVPELIKELILANESERSAAVVILADRDKEAMDTALYKALPERKTTKIVTTMGAPTSGSELRRVSLETARSVVILSAAASSDDERQREMADLMVLKTVMAILASQQDDNDIPIIAQVHTKEKQALIESFDDDQIIALDIEAIMSQLITQTSLSSGLQVVYNEMFSFDGGEIYFVDDHGQAGKRFADIAAYMVDGVPMGLWTQDGGVELRPDPETILVEGQELIVFAEDDSTIEFVDGAVATFVQLAEPAAPIEKRQQRTLIIGWSHMGRSFVEENADYLQAGSTFTVLIPQQSHMLDADLAELGAELPALGFDVRICNVMDAGALAAADPYGFDVVYLVGANPEETLPERIDAAVLVVLHLLRQLSKVDPARAETTRVVTQVLNPENQELMIQSRADDFVISDKMTTMILAQMSEEPRMRHVYDDLFQEDGSEIYLKSAALYLGTHEAITAPFSHFMATAMARDEICLGFRKADTIRDADANFGVTLNPKKAGEITLTRADFLVVLSQDEL